MIGAYKDNKAMVQERIYRYFENNPVLHVLFVFDRMDIIKVELDAAEWKDGYVYKVFDGAWFNAKYSIEHTWRDKRVVLLFGGESYPQTEAQLLSFPLLDLLKANMEYQEEGYASFLQQYGLPQKYAAFVKRHIGEMMSAKLHAMLQPYYTPEAFHEEVVCRALISSYLGEKKLLDWDMIVVKLLVLGLASEEKKRLDFFYRVGKSPDVRKALDDKLRRIFGRTYEENTPLKMQAVAASLKYNIITRGLAPVPSDDYKIYKVSSEPALDQLVRIYETGVHDRALGGKFQEAVSVLASDIKEEKLIACYGVDAPYFYLTEALCWPILQKSLETGLVADPASVTSKVKELTLKMPPEAPIQFAFRFVEQLSLYYATVHEIGSLKLDSPEEYARKYLSEYYLVDFYYRRSVEAFHALVEYLNPEGEGFSDAKARLDQDYARICHTLNWEWISCVQEKGEGFASLSLPKQEDFFSLVCDKTVKQVVIVSDALRYELAAELRQELLKETSVAKLSAMRSMLPTETKFCKNALLPHHALELRDTEMAVDGQVLKEMEQRSAQLKMFKERAVCVSFDYVMNSGTAVLKELFKNTLVYIYHDSIDRASHSQSPFEVIRACREAVRQLAVLVKRLHYSYSITNVLITADHGFLYNDIPFEEKDKLSVAGNNGLEKDGKCLELKTRYYLTANPEPVEGVAKFALETVSGVKTASPVYVAVPCGTNRFAAPGGYAFAHGGASLQEMLVPVIYSSRRNEKKTEKVGLVLKDSGLSVVSSLLRFKLVQSEAVSSERMGRTVVCCLYQGDEPVSNEQQVVMDNTEAEGLRERVYEVSLRLVRPCSGGLLQLRVYDVEDPLNPLVKENVRNNTLVERDF